MKVFVPYRGVYPPALTAIEKDRLCQGGDVELRGNLREGDAFILRWEAEPFHQASAKIRIYHGRHFQRF